MCRGSSSWNMGKDILNEKLWRLQKWKKISLYNSAIILKISKYLKITSMPQWYSGWWFEATFWVSGNYNFSKHKDMPY